MNNDEKDMSKLTLIVLGIILLSLSCSSKKKVTQSSSKLTEDTRTKEQTITATRSDALIELKQYEVGHTIIYPSESVKINPDGSVEGKMDSIKINQVSFTTLTQDKTDTTYQDQNKETEESSTAETSETKKDVKRNTNLLGWIGGVALLLFFVFIVFKVKSFIP